MFKKLIETFRGMAAKSDVTQARSDEEITLGASADVSSQPLPEPINARVERRARPRVIQHTERLSQGPKIYRDNGSGYVNETDENDRLTYEQAREMQAMPKPELEEKFGTELFIFKQARTLSVPVGPEK